MWFYICYYFFETSAADGKQKRIINVNVIQVVSALLLSITRYITTNVCSVFKWQQLDIVRKWARCTFEDFSFGFVFANYKNLVKSNTLINKHHQNFLLYPGLLLQKLHVLLKAITSHAMAMKILYKVIQM